MTKLVSSLEDLCLDAHLSFTVEKSVGTNTFVITPDSASQAIFDRMKNGSYIKFWNAGESKKGIAIVGKFETGPNVGLIYMKVIAQIQNAVDEGDSLYTYSYFNKNYKFLNEYQTLQDILEYFQAPADVNNAVDFILDNGGLSQENGVLMVEPYNSRHILMSPTQESKLGKLPYVISLYQPIYVNTRTSMFYIKKVTSEKSRLFRVHGSCTNGRQFDFDIDISSPSGTDVVTVYNRPRGFYMNLFICLRKASNDDLYYQVCFERDEKNPEMYKDFTVDVMSIETPFPDHIKYDINPYPNYQTFLNWAQDDIELTPRFIMADTTGAYVEIGGSGTSYYKTVANEGTSKVIPASTHNRGLMPSVECYGIEQNVNRSLQTEVLINQYGDVEVTWNGGVSLADPVLIVIK